MTKELTKQQQADICAVHAKLGEALAIVEAMGATPYLHRDRARAVADSIETLQTDLVRSLISGELPIQPAPVIQRDFIGKRD